MILTHDLNRSASQATGRYVTPFLGGIEGVVERYEDAQSLLQGLTAMDGIVNVPNLTRIVELLGGFDNWPEGGQRVIRTDLDDIRTVAPGKKLRALGRWSSEFRLILERGGDDEHMIVTAWRIGWSQGEIYDSTRFRFRVPRQSWAEGRWIVVEYGFKMPGIGEGLMVADDQTQSGIEAIHAARFDVVGLAHLDDPTQRRRGHDGGAGRDRGLR